MRIGLLLISGVFLWLPGSTGAALPVPGTGQGSGQEAYTVVVPAGEGFLAGGPGGKLDWISAGGTITRSEILKGEAIHSLLATGHRILVAGKQGSLLIGSDQDAFRKIASGTDLNINSLAEFRQKIVAGCDHGGILLGDTQGIFTYVPLDLKGNIVSVSANSTDCYGVSDQGEIIHSGDGLKWDIFDFNRAYSGYYKACRFTKALVTEKQVAVIGLEEDGQPAMYFSSGGKVWTERSLIYKDGQGMSRHLADTLNDLYYDQRQDRFYLVSNHGKLMILPSCSHCNELYELAPENLYGISGNANSIIVVGEKGFLKISDMDFYQ